MWSRDLGSAIICVAATPNVSFVAAACIDGGVSLFSGDGEPCWQRAVPGEAWAIAISADGASVAVGTASKHPAAGTVFVFDRAGEERWRLSFDAPVWSVALSDDGRRLVVGCWDNFVYLFEETQGQLEELSRVKLGEAGVYGTSISADGRQILAAAYDRSVTLFDETMTVAATHACASGTYHTALSRDGSWGVVGLRDGRAMLLQPQRQEPRYTELLSQRAICGAAVSSGGTAAFGSFDGRAYVTTSEGRVLWSLYTEGEVWATALSSDASLLVVGSGDRILRIVRNHANDAAIHELQSLEARVERMEGAEALSGVEAAVAAFRKYGLIDYAIRRLADWIPRIGRDASNTLALRLLRDDTEAFPTHRRSHFQLASIYEAQQDWRHAALYYTRAGQADHLRLQSLTKAGEAFARAGLDAAAKSSFRRAREQQITEDARRTLYSLARAYEDTGRLDDARRYYEVVYTLNPDYRDVYTRLERLTTLSAAPTPKPSAADVDWHDSLLLGLLGPDVPRMLDVDQSLRPILHARSKELAVTVEERKRILSVISEHGLVQDAGIPQSELDYDVVTYMRYDRSVPEDEAKKSLELVHALDCIGRYGPFRTSLDIGSATGRYPTILANLGVAAFGLDVEPEAVEYARRKRGDASNPEFRVGDARTLPFEDERFDLITCMMGTAAHFPPDDLERVLGEIRRCLRPRGISILSTWDIECVHQTFLSIYSHAQMEEMRRNSPTRRDIQAIYRRQGFVVEDVRPIGLMPESITYELDLQRRGTHQLAQLVDLELAFRAMSPELHGQMYMVIARKD
ncbi:MAG TPA: methyltransferase domain-containing protein [Kofleriaceae bacterium]|nr:methyltransferase domain-containing protein [Kofleriaceae bacterium]